MTSVPMASIAIFISRAWTSPPWFSHASFTPESTMRERMPRTALIMLSRCISICGRSGSPPRMQRMHDAPKICDALSERATCSSSVPFCALNERALGHTDAVRELQLDAEPIGVLADRAERRLVGEHRLRHRDHRPASA